MFWAVALYRLTVETGQFEIIKDSVGRLTQDRRLQALLIAFAFGAFIEGAAGFGTPVAVAAAMLTGLGFSPFYAAAICLIANTAPVAFGAIGTPLVTLAGVTNLPLAALSADVGTHLRARVTVHPGLSDAGDGRTVGLCARSGRRALVCGVCFRRHAVSRLELHRARISPTSWLRSLRSSACVVLLAILEAAR